MLTVGDMIHAKVVDLDFNGQGVIKHEGYVIFVKGLLKDEEARIKITQIKKNFGQAISLEIIKKSIDRVTHPQSLLGSCDLLHMHKDMQLTWQQEITKNTLSKIMNKDIHVDPTITDFKDMNYRNKSVFHVMNKPYLSLGLYHKDEHRLIEVTSFVLSDSKTNEILNHLNHNKIIVDYKILNHIVIRTNSKQEALVTLVATKKQFTGLDHIVTQLLKLKNIKGITLNISNDKIHILGDYSYNLYGENILVEPLNGVDVYINDRSFFQVNLPVAKMMYQLISDHIKPNSTVIDAYSGVGSIGYYLIRKLSKLTLIESNKEAVTLANMTKSTYDLTHVDVINGYAEEHIQTLDADVLIVDPPRNGLMPAFLSAIANASFDQIIYLSCDAKTLARDLNEITKSYEIQKVYPIRMFYHTTSLETLVILKKI